MTVATNTRAMVREALDIIKRLEAVYGIEPDLRSTVKLWIPPVEDRAVEAARECSKWRQKYSRDSEVIAALLTWDDERERQRVQLAFEWGARATVPGAWVWVTTARPDCYCALREEIDTAFDIVRAGLNCRKQGDLFEGLVRFKTVILELSWHYRHKVQRKEDRDYFARKHWSAVRDEPAPTLMGAEA